MYSYYAICRPYVLIDGNISGQRRVITEMAVESKFFFSGYHLQDIFFSLINYVCIRCR